MNKKLKRTTMRLYQQIQNEFQADNLSNLFLYGSIMFAGIDYTGILDYLIKVIIGGGVWFGFKLLQDYYSLRIKERARKNINGKEPQP
jgi:hypothetical protein